jgi:hypothetical protein
MVAKKKITAQNIIEFYMDYILENNEQPKSVYAFSKLNNFDEAMFYAYFGSFDAINKKIFRLFFDNTLKVLLKTDEYENYDARNKLLSFYFTFFENLTANRSYVVNALNKHKNNLQAWKDLSDLKSAFEDYIDKLDIETIDLKEERLMNTQKAAIRNSAWIQLMITMKFWLDDQSAGFEKTDIFIEKSVNTSFDLLNIKPIQSVIDLGKFIWKEKMHSKV